MPYHRRGEITVKKLLFLVLLFITCTGFEQKSQVQTYYWPDGITKYAEGPVVNGKRHGIWTEWHRNGKRSETGTYVRGIKDGNWMYWRDNGQVSAEMKYERGVLLSANSYRPDGTVGSHIRNGSGKWMTWYKNGKKERECEYVNGKLSGKLIMWYENGRKSSECEFLDNIPHGKHIYYWHETSLKSYEGKYSHGQEHGRWIFYDKKGRITDIVEYEHGKRVKWRKY